MKAARTAQIALAACLFLATNANAQDAPAKNGPDELPTLLQLKGDPVRGKTVFAPCGDCHRKDGGGRANGVFPRLAGQHVPVLIKQLSDIRSGRRNNPSMQPLASALSQSDIADVAAYVQSLPISPTNGKGPGTGVARGKQLYERDCASCHGGNGEGEAAKFYPMVAAQHYRYLVREVVSIRDGDRRNSDPQMVQVVKDYSQSDIDAVADFIAQLPPPRR